jgi:hypothetical protein
LHLVGSSCVSDLITKKFASIWLSNSVSNLDLRKIFDKMLTNFKNLSNFHFSLAPDGTNSIPWRNSSFILGKFFVNLLLLEKHFQPKTWHQ